MSEYSWQWAFAVCIIAAVLEGVLAGGKVKQRFAELQLPRYALLLWTWFIIGAAYYVLFFMMLNSLLGSTPTPRWTTAALVLVAILLSANAAWNVVFFRKKNLRLSFVLFVPYIPVALALAFVLFRVGSPLARWYLLYVGYIAYATWWSWSVWRLNRPSQ